MKYLLILLFALVLAQDLTEEKNILRNSFEQGTEDLLIALLQEYFELINLIEDIEQHQGTQQIPFAEKAASLPQTSLLTDIPFTGTWDTDGCLNLTNTLADATTIAGNISSWVLNTSVTLGQTLYHLLHCGSINPISSVSCIVGDFSTLKNIVDEGKPIISTFRHELVQMVGALKTELNDCLGTNKIP